MIFGISESKFTYSGSTVLLDHSNLIPQYMIPDNRENTSVITGHKALINLGDYSSFDVVVELHKYTASSAAFTNFYSYLHKNVYFYPHREGQAISGSNNAGIPFNITEMEINYLNNTDFDVRLKMHFEATGYTYLTGSLI